MYIRILYIPYVMLTYLTRLCEYKQRPACGVSLPSQVSPRRHLLCLYMYICVELIIRTTAYIYNIMYIFECVCANIRV